ncbi:MAG: hypothetical protein IT360_20095 [Gemmatimonadaceae bacterium]|nr:hypothetical protein [Gemmatimonadaceae bacterium]
MKRARMALGAVGLMLGIAGASSALPAQSSGGATRQVVARLDTIRMARVAAQSRSAAGDHRAAAMQYGRVIATIGLIPGSFRDEAILADAYFGRASAWLQLRRGTTAADGAGVVVANVLRDYDAAIAIDSARFLGAAHNNAGLLLRDAGNHRDALTRFLAAGRTAHPARGAFLMNAAGEFAALGQADSAAATYRAALREDSTLAGAREGLLRAFAARPSADSLLRLASTWSSDPRHSPQVADAMYEVLSSARWRRGGAVNTTVADSCLLLLALNLATQQLGPADIASSHVSRLRGIAKAEPSTAAGADALLAAYATDREEAARVLDGQLPALSWWNASNGRHSVWSTVLGSIGRWYDTRDDDQAAMKYYEASLGMPWRGNQLPRWSDIDFIFPLAVLYAQPSNMAVDSQRLDRMIDGVFGGKMNAYELQDVPRIRRFHTALGAFFASRGVWERGARGAIFQLEHMREMTRRINAEHRPAPPLYDSPELLLQLHEGYCRTGATQRAAALAREIAAEYRRLGRPQPPTASCETSPGR